MEPEIVHSSSFVVDAVALIAAEAETAIAERGLFRLSLCGGNTPRSVYALLARSGLPWDRVQITFGDERCVPPDSDQSNFRMARETLLESAAIPAENVFRMRGEIDPKEAAREYEAKLAAVAARFGEARYRHDLLLLGIGDDGHTASLFPGTSALEETERDVVANFVPKFDAHRITFTFPLIAAARRVCFLVNDPAKEEVVRKASAGDLRYPSGRVCAECGRVAWLLGF